MTGSKCPPGHKHPISQDKSQTLCSTRTGSKCHTETQASNNIGLKLRFYTQPGLNTYILTYIPEKNFFSSI